MTDPATSLEWLRRVQISTVGTGVENDDYEYNMGGQIVFTKTGIEDIVNRLMCEVYEHHLGGWKSPLSAFYDEQEKELEECYADALSGSYDLKPEDHYPPYYELNISTDEAEIQLSFEMESIEPEPCIDKRREHDNE